MKKNFIMIMAAVTMSLGMAMTSFAGTDNVGREGQWIQDEVGWRWQYADGTYAQTWNWLDGNGDGVCELYLFGSDNYMLANATSGDGMQVNEDGAWVKDGVVQTTAVQMDNGVAAVAETAEDAGTEAAESTDATVEINSDNGGYDEYGISKVAAEMVMNTREENEKYGEVGCRVDFAGHVYDWKVLYANGFMVTYKRGEEYNADQQYVDVATYERDDLDPSYLFKYYDPDLSVEEARDKLLSNGYQYGTGTGRTYSDSTVCFANSEDVHVQWTSGGVVLFQRNDH